jgi:hypothetical protein
MFCRKRNEDESRFHGRLTTRIAVLIFSRRYSRYAAGALALDAATSLVLRALNLRS